MNFIANRLCIGGLDSRINASADELQVGEVIIRSPQYHKTYMVASNCERVDFGSLFCPYNILTNTQKRIKGEETLAEVFKHKKYLSRLKISEDKSITVYTFSIVAPDLIGGKRSTKSDIGPLPQHIKWRNKSF